MYARPFPSPLLPPLSSLNKAFTLDIVGLDKKQTLLKFHQTPNAIVMPARCPPQLLAGRCADFVKQFTAKQRAADERIAKQPKPLTAEQREALHKQLEAVQFLQPDYADTTKTNLAGLLRKWKR